MRSLGPIYAAIFAASLYSLPRSAEPAIEPPPQSQTVSFPWEGEAPCQDGVFNFDVPQVDFEVESVIVEVEHRGTVEVRSIGSLYGINPAFGGCAPNVDHHTRWRVTGSELGVGVSFDPSFPIVGSCPSIVPASVQGASDVYLSSRAHEQPIPYLLASNFEPETLFTSQKRSIAPAYTVETFTEPHLCDTFEGTYARSVWIAQAFSYGVEWLGCDHPYTPDRQHSFTVTVTLTGR